MMNESRDGALLNHGDISFPRGKDVVFVHYADGRLVAAAQASAPPPPVRLAKRGGSGVGKWAKRLVAAALIVTTLAWLVLPMVCPVTTQAVVNAKLVQIRAPIDGTTRDLAADLGAAVEPGAPLVTLMNNKADSIHLPGLQVKQSEVVARRARLVSEIGETEAAEKDLRLTAEKHRKGRVAVLQATLKERTTAIEVAQSNLQLRKKDLERVQGGNGAVPLQDVDSATESEYAARKKIESERAGLERIQEELKGAREGVYLVQEPPVCLQRAEELALKLPQLRGSLAEADELLRGVGKEVADEKARLGRATEAAVASPVAGVVWTRHGNAGQVVKQNETLFEIADGSSVFVEALLSQRHMPAINPGGRATVILTGGQTLTGRVRSVRTPGPDDAETSFAIKMGKQDLKQVRVLIDIDANAADVALVGRHVRVLIADEEPGAFQRGLSWLFNLGG